MKHLSCLLIATTMSFSAHAFSPDEFQTTDTDVEFADLVKRLDFNDADIRLKYKDSGTSVGMKVKRGDEKIGKWAPPNSATDPEAQVVAYTLGRFLGMRDLVVPSAYYVVQGPALATFVQSNELGERKGTNGGLGTVATIWSEQRRARFSASLWLNLILKKLK